MGVFFSTRKRRKAAVVAGVFFSTRIRSSVIGCGCHFSTLNKSKWRGHLSAKRCPLLQEINLLSEVVRCGATQKKPPRDSTKPYSPRRFTFSEVPQIAAYHNKLLKLRLQADNKIVVIAETRTAGDRITRDDVLLEVNQIVGLSLDSGLVEHLSCLLERRC